MKPVSLLILLFAILSIVFFTLPAFLSSQFAPYPLMMYGDVFDIFTPLVLIPIYWLLFQWSSKNVPGSSEILAFLLLAVIWVEGHSMHLAANSIGHLLGEPASEAARLTYFFDEELGHYLWHIGVLGLAAILVYREWRHPAGLVTSWLPTFLAGGFYGFNLFITIVEGQTVPMGLPFVTSLAIIGLVWGRTKLGRRPILTFFLASSVIALLLFTIWGLYWGGFPEFSEVGIIE